MCAKTSSALSVNSSRTMAHHAQNRSSFSGTHWVTNKEARQAGALSARAHLRNWTDVCTWSALCVNMSGVGCAAYLSRVSFTQARVVASFVRSLASLVSQVRGPAARES
jgi:hypothetical protein